MKTTRFPWPGVIAALFFLEFTAGAQPGRRQSLERHVPAAVALSAPVGRLEAGRELRLAIGLPLRHQEELTNLLRTIYDPTSPNYHHYLTPDQFAERFGPTKEDYQAVIAYARANGLRVAMTYSNRTVLDVVGPVSNIEQGFHVTLRTYAHPRENRLFYAPDVEPSLDLATPVLHISGLDNYALPRPMSVQQSAAGKPATQTGATPNNGSGPAGSYMGNDFRAAYVPGTSLNGAGQNIGLLEYDDGFFAQDILNYESSNGLPNVPVKSVLLDGTTGMPAGANAEVSLDIEMAISMCPGLSSVLVYEGMIPDDIMNQMATDDLAKQLSASWTYSIDATTEQIFQEFAAQGQSFFNASGDYDAYVGAVDPPTDDPYITIVGGTTLNTTGPGGSYVSETVWNWGDGIGTGGGISTTYAIPSWQQGINMTTNQGSTVYRNLPDVALTADNVLVMYGNGLSGAFGGTSCATPLWAGFTALINQQATATGQPTMGFINPAVYALGKGAGYGAVFHDITTGDNTSSSSPSNYFAVPGYDLCTGWGTPNGTNLINTLAPPDALQITPPAGFATVGGVGGPFTVTSETFTLTNAGSGALSWGVGNIAPWLMVTPDSGSLTPGGGATAVTVQLNAAASNLFLGTHAATLAFTNLADGTVQTRTFVLTVIKPPVITDQPASVIALGGATVSFSAGAAGGLPLDFQWQLNGTNLTNGGRISGAQTTLTGAGGLYGSMVSVLTISNVTAADTGYYALVASNAAGVAVSSNVVLAIPPSRPVITSQPVGQTVLVGAAVQLGVSAEGTAPFTYQWKLNQTNVTDSGGFSGSATPLLNIASASSADIGDYLVVVSNSLGSVTSTVAHVAVIVQAPGIQLVQNGGFETGSFAFWGASGNFVDCAVSGGSTAVHSGNFGALLGPAGSLGNLSQTLPTVAGQSYLLSLWLDSPDGLAPNEFTIAWDGTVIFDQTNIGAVGWTNLQFHVSATGTNAVLEFGFRDDQSFLGLDDIQVAPLVSADGPPIIAGQPADQVALAGGTASFSVLSAGQLPLFYQWQHAGASITNATNMTLTLTNVSTNDAGYYSVIVSNSLDFTTSSNALLTVLTGASETLTFDDLSGSDNPVPDGYGNLSWSNFYYLNPIEIGGPSGFSAGMISAPNIALNAYGTPAMISATKPFALLSGYLTAGWNDNLRVELKGFNGSALIFDKTYTLSATVPTLIAFNCAGVTAVEFVSSGGTPHPGYSGAGSHFAMDNLTIVAAPPTPVTVVHTFNGSDGGGSSAPLIQGTDGSFYGTTTYGGASGHGTVFRISTNGTLTTLNSFNGSGNGGYPYAGLVQGADGNFYGTTEAGGTYSEGTVFRVATNGTLTTLASFNYSVNGSYPYGGLMQASDGNFYGTTEDGGANGGGTVFKMTTNGALTTLASFDYSATGGYPRAGLVQGSDGNLYGTTEEGGTNGWGTVFRVTTNGALTALVSFNYSVNGGYPYAGLIQGTDGNFYGTTEEGGLNGAGTMFTMTTNGTLTTLASFNGSGNGGYPSGSLVQDAQGNFYGTTTEGGAYGGGTMFELTTNGTLATLLSFAGTNGFSPQAALVQGTDGNLYGTTSAGGLGFNGATTSGDGIVFCLGAGLAQTIPAIVAQPASQLAPVGGVASFSVTAAGPAPLSYYWLRNGSPIPGATNNGYATNNVQLSDSGVQFSCLVSNADGTTLSSNAALTVFNGSGPLYSFNGPDGGDSAATLVQGADGNYYGTTTYGGAYRQGTVFSITTNGALSTLVSFNSATNGSYPYAGLVQGSDGSFYGTTESGGTYGEGTVFKITTNGMLTTLVSFNYSVNGGFPYAGLVQGSDGNFYGTTEEGGASGAGTVFRVTTNGTLTTLASFNYSVSGGYPRAGLVQASDGNFYGTAEEGGTNSEGTVFRVTTNGTLTALVAFNYSTNGGYPRAELMQGLDGNFYGTTSEGGTYGWGTVFRMTTNGTLTTLLSFNGLVVGGTPYGGLLQGSDGNFYGTTTSGGTYGSGAVFRMSSNGTSFSSLFSFAGANGVAPQAGLIQDAAGNLFGTTAYGGNYYDGGGQNGNGTVFFLAGVVPAGPPVIATQPLSQSAYARDNVTFTVTATGALPLTYLWSRNNVPIPGATSSYFSTNNVQLYDSGAVFSCLVTNAYGSRTSSNAVLTVYPPPLLGNGGFELGNFSSWTTGGTFAGCSVTTNRAYVHSGIYGAQMGPVGSLGYIYQSVPTSVGETYLVSCWLNSDGRTPNQFQAYWNGTLEYNGANLGSNGWTNLQFKVTATGTSAILAFEFRNDHGFIGFDDVTVVPAPAAIRTIQMSGGNLTLSGMYGVSDQTNTVLMSTDVTLPLSQWTPIATNVFGSNGNFTITATNVIAPGNQQQFYILRLQ